MGERIRCLLCREQMWEQNFEVDYTNHLKHRHYVDRSFDYLIAITRRKQRSSSSGEPRLSLLGRRRAEGRSFNYLQPKVAISINLDGEKRQRRDRDRRVSDEEQMPVRLEPEFVGSEYGNRMDYVWQRDREERTGRQRMSSEKQNPIKHEQKLVKSEHGNWMDNDRDERPEGQRMSSEEQNPTKPERELVRPEYGKRMDYDRDERTERERMSSEEQNLIKLERELVRPEYGKRMDYVRQGDRAERTGRQRMSGEEQSPIKLEQKPVRSEHGNWMDETGRSGEQRHVRQGDRARRMSNEERKPKHLKREFVRSEYVDWMDGTTFKCFICRARDIKSAHYLKKHLTNLHDNMSPKEYRSKTGKCVTNSYDQVRNFNCRICNASVIKTQTAIHSHMSAHPVTPEEYFKTYVMI